MSTLLLLLPPSLATCPDRCIDPTWAAVQCVSLPACTVTPCTRVVDGVERQWASCSDPTPTSAPPTQMPCPDRCIDPTWAAEKCNDLPHCVVRPCVRVVNGIRRDWASCSDPTTAPTPTPTATPSATPTPAPSLMSCPDRCIDPTWAAEKCNDLPHCVVRPCVRVVNGIRRDWARCSDPTTALTPTPTTIPTPATLLTPCPNRCADPLVTSLHCAILPHCVVRPCVRSVNGFKTVLQSCSDPFLILTASPSPPPFCPTLCIIPFAARMTCSGFPGCRVVPCKKVVGKFTREWAQCSGIA